LELGAWNLVFKKGWDSHFKKFDKETQKRILKKLEQMKQPLQARGLKASKALLESAGHQRTKLLSRKDEALVLKEMRAFLAAVKEAKETGIR